MLNVLNAKMIRLILIRIRLLYDTHQIVLQPLDSADFGLSHA